ncbi:uncharacterized protein LOC125140878 [Tachysurus fulvidraco]|uniref:uncharacterized protein LOC125140878 n=1 Tax=Tachysurus fulvidraco TaxID=1234273 RepID=UPI001FEFCEA1|nr:uncharacterized protein LOC125140878 [Tachysurus fulvidraco]
MMSQGKSSLRFVTWNTRGIRNPDEKFSQVLQKLSNLQADIVFIQETHVGPKHYQILTDVKDWKVYFTVCRPSSKGVAILIKKTIPFEYISYDEDCCGGYIVLFCRLYGELYTLVNVYNQKDDRFVLGRLKEYLMQTAEGVLVVGGDFNTVLHPCLDRSPSDLRHSPFRANLEDFVVSLNLRDTWSYKHQDSDGFTRQDTKSYSRLDMFFMHSDTLAQVCDISVKPDQISDHMPVVLDLEIQHSKYPSGSDSTYGDQESKRISGKISGAEILSAIKTLANHKEQNIERLKKQYYQMLMSNQILKDFNKSRRSKDGHIFNVEYLIFSQILAKRLSVFITPSFKGKIAKKLDIDLYVTFANTELWEIKWSYIQRILEYLKKKKIPYAPPAKFGILDSLLPKRKDQDHKYRLLKPGCPLTNTILNLALKHLGSMVSLHDLKCKDVGEKRCKRHKAACKEIRSMASTCFQRQILLINTQSTAYKKVLQTVKDFEKISGLKIKIKKIKNQ